MRHYFGPHSFICISALVLLLTPSFSSVYAASFETNLRFGDRGADVAALQKILGVTETGYFGPVTQAAVMSFQKTYAAEVLLPAGLTQPTGFVGQLTRSKLNKLAVGGTVASTTTSTSTLPPAKTSPEVPLKSASSKAPSISKIIPDHGPYGGVLTIVGENFTDVNDIMTTYLPFSAVPSQDGHTIAFTFINPPFERLQQLRNAGKIGDMDIPFMVTVVNRNGTTTPPMKYTIEIRKR